MPPSKVSLIASIQGAWYSCDNSVKKEILKAIKAELMIVFSVKFIRISQNISVAHNISPINAGNDVKTKRDTNPNVTVLIIRVRYMMCFLLIVFSLSLLIFLALALKYFFLIRLLSFLSYFS